jgi:hypothetical protein
MMILSDFFYLFGCEQWMLDWLMAFMDVSTFYVMRIRYKIKHYHDYPKSSTREVIRIMRTFNKTD